MKRLFRGFQNLRAFSTLAAFLSPAFLAAHAGDYTYATNNGTLTNTRYTGSGGAVTIPASIAGLPVTSIGERAFSHCFDLASVTIPSSVTNIASCAFEYCIGLTNVTIPNTVVSIGHQAFRYCTSLEAVTIPGSVMSIGESPFEFCSSLKTITVDPGNPAYSSVDGVLFDQSANTLIEFPPGRPQTYTIPNSVTAIGDHAFFYSDKLTSVIIPNGVTSIGDLAFFGCTNMTLVTIPESVTAIGSAAFYRCDSLTSVTIPSTVTSIGTETFGLCFALTSVTIPNSVTNIGEMAFFVCDSLTNVTIGNGITTIADSAFVGCSKLKEVYFRGHAPTSVVASVFWDTAATIYYLPGTWGWGTTFGGRPTAPWLLPEPTILALPPDFGVTNNAFNFRVSWATNRLVLIQACTNLAAPTWDSVGVSTPTNGWFYFTDHDRPTLPARFYRVRPL